MRPATAVRASVIIVLSVIAVFLPVVAGWLIDDGWLGKDLPRRVLVAGVDISRTSETEARRRLDEAALDRRTIELHWAGQSITAPAADLGVVVDFDKALDEATDRGGLWGRPFRWLKSLFVGSSFDPVYELDAEVLADWFAVDDDSAFDLDFGDPAIELLDGEFVETDARSVPGVDIETLGEEVLAAVPQRSGDPARIDVPVAGAIEIDRGADETIDRVKALTEGGIKVTVDGDHRIFPISEAAVRKWIVFDHEDEETTIGLDHDLVMSTLRTLFSGLTKRGKPVEFRVRPLSEEVYFTGGMISTICCEPDTVDRLLAALENGTDVVTVHTIEDPLAKGSREWAESLQITEPVGEFTTYFRPGRSRVTNIARISDLIRGAVIAPGETFSVNDHVGRRTREKGFVSAAMILDGVFTPSVGGGISQFATTLFNAAFFAGLDFGEYQSHSIYISRYPYGREATVSYPHPDLEIINTTPYGVLLWPTTTEDSITVKLFSTPWVKGEQTGQSKARRGEACTRVTTERTRTWLLEDRQEIDHVLALYRPEGLACDGSSTLPTTTTTTTTPPTTTTTTTPPTTTTTATTTPPTTTTTTTTPPTTTATTPPTTTTTTPPTTTTTTTTPPTTTTTTPTPTPTTTTPPTTTTTTPPTTTTTATTTTPPTTTTTNTEDGS